MKNHVIRTRNEKSDLKKINKITKTKCFLKKSLHSESNCDLSIFVATSGGYSNSGPEARISKN